MNKIEKKLIHKIAILFAVPLFMGMAGNIHAQQKPLIDIAMDSAAILIGEQTKVHLTITTDQGNSFFIPLPKDTLMAGVELLAVLPPDTTVIENDKWLIKQDVLITSFDSALYLLPPFVVVSGNDTVYSEQLALKVSTLPVDTSDPTKFNDIKQVWEPPFVWADYYPIIYGVLLFLLALCIIAYIIKRMREKKSFSPTKKEKPKLPAHEQALLDLNVLKEQKLWQRGLNKEFYTSVTDILRKYIEERFNVSAMEMTSHEVLDCLKSDKDIKESFDGLKQILELADFVKFAKMHPLPSENEKSLTGAYLFVESTTAVKVEEESSSADAVAKETNNK